MRSYVLTDDPADPCALCVGWNHPDGPDVVMDSLNVDEFFPIAPDGSRLDRMYRDTHSGCEASVTAYMDDLAHERATWRGVL